MSVSYTQTTENIKINVAAPSAKGRQPKRVNIATRPKRKQNQPQPGVTRKVVAREMQAVERMHRAATQHSPQQHAVISNIVKQLTLPYDAPNGRATSAYSTMETSVVTASQSTALGVEQQGTGCVSAGQFIYVQCSSPTCDAIIYRPAADVEGNTKDLIVYSDGAYTTEFDVVGGAPLDDPASSPFAGVPVALPFIGALDTDQLIEWAGTITGERSDFRFVYLDLGTVDVDVNAPFGAPDVPAFNLQVWYWDGSDAPVMVYANGTLPLKKNAAKDTKAKATVKVVKAETTTSTTTPRSTRAKHRTQKKRAVRQPRDVGVSDGLSVTISERGYYYFAVGFNNDASFFSYSDPLWFTVHHTLANGESQMYHRPMVDLANNAAAVASYRVIADGRKITNATPQLALGGMAAAKTIATGKNWLGQLGELNPGIYNTTIDAFGALSQVKDVTTMRIDNGIYGFIKPVSEETYEMIDDFSTDLNVISDVWSAFAPTTRSNVLYCFNTPVSGVSIPSFTVQSATTIEFATDDQWRPTSITTISNADFLSAVQVVRDVTQFTENPLHVATIMRDINRVVSGTGKIARNIFGQFNKTVPSARKAVGNLL